MRKRSVLLLILTVVIFGAVFGFKAFGNRMMNQYFDTMPQPPATITAAAAELTTWDASLEAVGSMVAINGTEVTTEVGGIVESISFDSGAAVKAGDVLLTLNAKADRADLRSLLAQAALAKTERARIERLYKLESVPKSELESADSQAEQAIARAEAQRARVQQKTITAPFEGLLGIRQANLGQYLEPGKPIVTLQSLDPIYVRFGVPERELPQVRMDLEVRIELDGLAGRRYSGHISAIEPRVDPTTRNFNVQATFANPGHVLRPGQFARVRIALPQRNQVVVVVPRTAISYNPYGNSVYVVQEAGKSPAPGNTATTPDQAPQQVVRQRFIKTGEVRGDLVVVTEGLKTGERFATSGLLKLRNDSRVIINNTVPPASDRNPSPPNS